MSEKAMKKPFKINIKAFATVIVYARNEEEALEYTDEVDFGNITMDEAWAKPIPKDDLESEKRHADLVLRSSLP